MTFSVGPIHWGYGQPSIASDLTCHKTTTKQTKTYMYKKQTNMSSIPLPAGLMTLSVGPIHWGLVSPPLPLISQSQNNHKTNKNIHVQETNKQTNMSSIPLPAGLMTLSVVSNPLRLGQPSIASDLTVTKQPSKQTTYNKHTDKQTNKQTNRSSIPLPAGLMTLSVGPIHWGLVRPPLPLISHSHRTTKQTKTYMYKKETNKHEFNTSSCRLWWHYQ